MLCSGLRLLRRFYQRLMLLFGGGTMIQLLRWRLLDDRPVVVECLLVICWFGMVREE